MFILDALAKLRAKDRPGTISVPPVGTKPKMAIARLKERTSDGVDSGFEYPNQGYRVFMSRPANIRNEMLSPTDKTNFLRKSSSFSLRM